MAQRKAPIFLLGTSLCGAFLAGETGAVRNCEYEVPSFLLSQPLETAESDDESGYTSFSGSSLDSDEEFSEIEDDVSSLSLSEQSTGSGLDSDSFTSKTPSIRKRIKKSFSNLFKRGKTSINTPEGSIHSRSIAPLSEESPDSGIDSDGPASNGPGKKKLTKFRKTTRSFSSLLEPEKAKKGAPPPPPDKDRLDTYTLGQEVDYFLPSQSTNRVMSPNDSSFENWSTRKKAPLTSFLTLTQLEFFRGLQRMTAEVAAAAAEYDKSIYETPDASWKIPEILSPPPRKTPSVNTQAIQSLGERMERLKKLRDPWDGITEELEEAVGILHSNNPAPPVFVGEQVKLSDREREEALQSLTELAQQPSISKQQTTPNRIKRQG